MFVISTSDRRQPAYINILMLPQKSNYKFTWGYDFAVFFLLSWTIKIIRDNRWNLHVAASDTQKNETRI